MTVAFADSRALGALLRVAVTRPARLANARAAVDSVVREVDRKCSRFRDDSELSRVNRAAGRRTQVSPALMGMLGAALRAARLTDGAVDPTVGPAVSRAGYDRDFELVLPENEAAPPPPPSAVAGWRSIEIDEAASTVRVGRGGDIDLGATAKALASDLAACAGLRAAGDGGVLVSIGGDIAVAGEAPPGGWRVLAEEDSNAPGRDGGEAIHIRSGAIATSSTTIRRWTRGGVDCHHIVDPSTGLPTSGRWRTVSVVAATCLDANIAATAAIVRSDDAIGRLTSLNLPSRLVDQSGVVTRIAGWPARD